MTVKKGAEPAPRRAPEAAATHSAPPSHAAGDRDARAAVLAAARKLILGGEELTVSAVAAEAGVSRQTVHARFGGARGLRAELAAEGLLEPQPEDTETTRDRLIAAAVRLLSQPGGGFVSVEAIAAEAGLTKGAVYHHFADRREILRAVAQRVSPVEEMKAKIMPVADLPARDGLIAIATAYYDAMRARADLIRNLAANYSRDPELASVVITEIIGQGAPMMMLWFAYQVERGELRPVDPAFVIQSLFGPVFLLIVLGPRVFDELTQIGIHPAVDNVEGYVDMLLAGLAPAGKDNGGTE